jgi:hypothetical protein
MKTVPSRSGSASAVAHDSGRSRSLAVAVTRGVRQRRRDASSQLDSSACEAAEVEGLDC